MDNGDHDAAMFRLDAAAYWELRTRVADAQRAEQVVQQAHAALEQARAKLGQHLAALSSEHGFNPASAFRCDDATLTLSVTPEGPTGT